MSIRVKSIAAIAFSILIMQAIAQGTLTGTICDETTGEVLPGVNITNQEKLVGTASGSDGEFSLQLSSGRHDIKISIW